MTTLSQSAAQRGLRSVSWILARPVTRGPLRAAALAHLLLPALLLVTVAPSLRGQALPAAEASPISTGFAVPHVAGTLNYAVSASESLSWGYYASQGAAVGTNLTGDLGYISNSKLDPFSAVFSGGYSWAESGEPSYSFLNLGISQALTLKRWSVLISDGVSYLPSTPTTGLSGVPGVGDLGTNLGVNPVGAETGQGVLTDYSDRVSNSISGSVQRPLTGKTFVSGFGSYSNIYFLDSGSAGLNSDDWTGGAEVSHQLNARTSFGGNYSYSNYSYPANTPGVLEAGFVSQTAAGQFMHHFTRKLTVTASAGPQWTSVNFGSRSQNVSFFASASATYRGKTSQANVYYSRGTNSGYGVVSGALSQGGGVSVSRTFARVWNCSASASYTETSGLAAPNFPAFNFDTAVAAIQTSRAIVRSISVFASYTFQHQSNGGNTGVDAFTGLEQVLGFGITYSPTSIHFGRQ